MGSRAGPYLLFLSRLEECQEIRVKLGWGDLMATEVGRVVLEAEDRRQTDLPEPIYFIKKIHVNGEVCGCMKEERHRASKRLVLTHGFCLLPHQTLNQACRQV